MKIKRILVGLVVIGGLNFMSAQINQAVDASQNPGQSFFYDAAGFGDPAAYGDKGKGLVFPRTDLTQFEFITEGAFALGNYYSCYDGMVVYNTKGGVVNQDGTKSTTKGKRVDVEPGFYYFSNPGINGEDDQCTVTNGEWKRIGGGPSATGSFWTLNGNGGTTPVNVSDLVDPANGDYSFDPADKNFIGTTDNKSVTFATGEGNESDGFKTVARLAIGDIKNRTVEQTDFNFVMEVYGKAHFEDGIVTKASTYPDYVFDNYFTGKSEENPNYKFKKLNEVEQFIKENNHLPGVTSIKELTKSENGYNVDNTQLSIQTLEKVEELYLHLIEQQKEIQALKAQIAELKK